VNLEKIGKHNVSLDYKININSQVKMIRGYSTWNSTLGIYDVEFSNDANSFYYDSGELYWNTIKDENENLVHEFYNKKGKLILKRTSVYSDTSFIKPIEKNENMVLDTGKIDVGGILKKELEGNSIGNILDKPNNLINGVVDDVKEQGKKVVEDSKRNIENIRDQSVFIVNDRLSLGESRYYTYYVYDQYDNLVSVLPPLADGKTDQVTLDKLCYQYKYDAKHRLVASKMPGKDWEYRVYDKIDRIIASGPVYSPLGDDKKGWMFMKFDAFNRNVYSGFYDGVPATALGRKSYQDEIDKQSICYENKSDMLLIGQVLVPYTNKVYPITKIEVLKINYFDDYKFLNSLLMVNNVENQMVRGDVTGYLTGSWSRVLTNKQEVVGNTSCLLYDAKGRVIRKSVTNYFKSYTEEDVNYNYRGLMQKKITRHKYKQDDDNVNIIIEKFEYDFGERLKYQTYKVNNEEEVVLYQNVYDELGRVIQKRIGGKLGFNLVSPITSKINEKSISNNSLIANLKTPVRNSFLQEINFRYNVRGWLKGINNVDDLAFGDFGKNSLFAMELSYNTLENENIKGVGKMFNGTVTEQTWRTSSDNILRRYSYAYDNLNRLKFGKFQEPMSVISNDGKYDEMLSYDANGNILTLNRKGNSIKDGLVVDLDVLTYNYDGNQLKKVIDSSNNTDGFKQGSNAITHYEYDDFGNLKIDKNKGIINIKYNHLNLPIEITLENGKIEYFYTSDGVKVHKKVTQKVNNRDKVDLTDYLGSFQYLNGKLIFLKTSEGYFNAETNNFIYEYKDYLGNVRLTFSDLNKNEKIESDEILKENNYYPFGLVHSGYNEKDNSKIKNYKYEYNGKEYQDELNLNLLDYGARNYDSAIARWVNVDPLAEKYPGTSPYVFVGNNPIVFIDDDGKDYRIFFDSSTRTVTISATYYALQEDIASLQEAVSFWNDLSGNYTYDFGSNNNRESYCVNFDLSIQEVASSGNLNKRGDLNQALSADKSEGKNVYMTGDTENANTNGHTSQGNIITIQPTLAKGNTGKHEIGHSLGVTHSERGLMTPGSSDPKRSTDVNSNDIRKIIEAPLNGKVNYEWTEEGKRVSSGKGTLINKTNYNDKDLRKRGEVIEELQSEFEYE
jgi:RHS repeat-associated protein